MTTEPPEPIDPSTTALLIMDYQNGIIPMAPNPEELLAGARQAIDLIRSYGGTVQNLVSGHLEQALKQFLSQHPQARERTKPFGAADAPRPRGPEEGYKALSSVRIRDNEKDRDESNLTK